MWRDDPTVLDKVKFEDRTYDKCLEAVKNNGIELYDVPFNHRTHEMCLTAVKSRWQAIDFVPDYVMLEDTKLEIATVVVGKYGDYINDVPESMRTNELWLLALETDPTLLKELPQELQTYDVYLDVVSNHGNALYYVPQELRDLKMCNAAITASGNALRYVPTELIDYDMCKRAVQSPENNLVHNYIPQKLMTEELQKLLNYRVMLEYDKEITIDHMGDYRSDVMITVKLPKE